MRPRVLLVNPNSSTATTQTMAAMVGEELPTVRVRAVTARTGPAMLITEEDLQAATLATIEAVTETPEPVDGVIVAAFGDPGLTELSDRLTVPVVGIGESSIQAAAAQPGMFGIATTTPGLEGSIHRQVERLGLVHRFVGVQLTEEDPLALAADPELQTESLAAAVHRCAAAGAGSVVIGGGPLGSSADVLSELMGIQVVNPVRAACSRLQDLLERVDPGSRAAQA